MFNSYRAFEEDGKLRQSEGEYFDQLGLCRYCGREIGNYVECCEKYGTNSPEATVCNEK